MPEPTKKSPELKALRYAENELGVHKVMEKAEKARAALDETLTLLSDHRDKLRDAEAELTDREMQLVITEKGKLPSESQAAFERHMKITVHSDELCEKIRGQIRQFRSDIDGFECDRAIAEADIRISVARLNELGGYLQYLAAIKLSQLERKYDAPTVKGESIW